MVQNFRDNVNSIYDWNNQSTDIQQLYRLRISTRQSNTKYLAYSCYRSGWISAFFIRHIENRDDRNKSRLEHISTHCQILFSEFQRYDDIVYAGQTVKEFFSKFRYGNFLRQHLQTGHPEIYEPLKRVIQSNKTLEDLKDDEDYNLYELRLEELSHGIELKTRVLGGACDECLQYHDKKARKDYEKILHPET
ncbi:MAG: hypothetical protein WA941_21440 [Nitrososphaeraceae archaeon]